MGWASGFQAGSQVAQRALDAYEKSQKRYAYDQALKGVGIQELYAPTATEQQAAAANAETQALAAQDAQEFGLAVPEQYTQRQAGEATAPTRYSLAGQTYDQRPSQDMVGLARTEALARATERFDPIEAQRLRATALQMKGQIAEQAYNEKYRPLQLQSAQTKLASDRLSLGEAQQKATERTNMVNYQAAVAELPPDQQNNSQVLVDLATKFKLTTKQQDELIAARAGRSTNEITLARNDITKLIKNKSLDELSELHKTNDMLDPGRHFEVLRDKKGAVTLQMVDSATGKPIGAPAFTGSEAEATKYLYTAASAPETLAEYAASVAKAKLDATKTQSEIDKNKALGAAAVTNAAAAKANATSTENYRRAQGLQKFVNANGDTVILDVAKLPVRDDGTVQIPQGLRPATEKVEPSEAVVQKLAENLIGTPKGGLDEEGKPLVYSASEAYAEAYRTAFAARNPGSVRRAPKTPADILAEEIELRRQAGPRGGPNAVGIDGTQRRMQTRPFEPNQDF